MINTPERDNAFRLPLHIHHSQIIQGIESKRNVSQSARGRVLGPNAGHLSNRYAVVLVVIGQEGEEVTLVCCLGAEDLLVEVYHGVELGDLENDVGEFGGLMGLDGRLAKSTVILRVGEVVVKSEEVGFVFGFLCFESRIRGVLNPFSSLGFVYIY